MAATMQDVARLAGVSIKTVSDVVNNYPWGRRPLPSPLSTPYPSPEEGSP